MNTRATILAIMAFALSTGIANARGNMGGHSSGNGAGSIACHQDLDRISHDYQAKAPAMTAPQRHDFEQNLQVAYTQCEQSLNTANPTLSRLREQLAAAPENPPAR